MEIMNEGRLKTWYLDSRWIAQREVGRLKESRNLPSIEVSAFRRVEDEEKLRASEK